MFADPAVSMKIVFVAVYSALRTVAALTLLGGDGTPSKLYVVPPIRAKIAVFKF